MRRKDSWSALYIGICLKPPPPPTIDLSRTIRFNQRSRSLFGCYGRTRLLQLTTLFLEACLPWIGVLCVVLQRSLPAIYSSTVRYMLVWFKVKWMPPGLVKILLECWSYQSFMDLTSLGKDIWRLTPFVICWCVWEERKNTFLKG